MINSTQRDKIKQLILMLPLILLNACGGGSGQGGAGNTDNNAPTVSIKFPGLNAITEKNTVLVRGVANDESAITYLAVNGVEATTSDGYANWQVTVPLQRGDNTLAVEVRDEFSNTDTAAASLQVISIDRIMYEPTRMALDAVNNRLFVIDELRRAVFEVDTVTGQRRIFSDATTPDALQPFSIPRAIALDTVNNRLLVADAGRDALFAVDMATGSRSIISGSATYELDIAGGSWSDLVVDASANIAYSLNSSNDTIISINLTTGQRAVLSSDTVPDGVNPLSLASALALDAANARLLVANINGLDVIAVDLTTGQRTVFSARDPAASSALALIQDLAIDVPNNRVLALPMETFEGGGDVIAIDLATGARTVLADYLTASSPYLWQYGMVLDANANRALISNRWNNEIVSVNLSTGKYSVLSGLSNIPGAASTSLTSPGSITVDAANNRALIANRSQIIAMSLDSGVTTVFSDNTTPDALNPFSSIADLELDEVNNRLLAFNRDDSGKGSILSVNLATGARTVLSNSTIPDANFPIVNTPNDLAIDRDNNRVLALHGYNSNEATITAVDLSTGARSILSDAVTPNAAVPFASPLALAVDAANGRALVANPGNSNILSVGLATGARTVFSNVGAGNILVDAGTNRAFLLSGNEILDLDLINGNTTVISPPSTTDSENAFIFAGDGFAIDNTNERLLVTDWRTKSVYAVDIPSGERVIVSR